MDARVRPINSYAPPAVLTVDVLLERIGEAIGGRPGETHEESLFALTLASYLALKYPLPSSLAHSKAVLQRCIEIGSAGAGRAAECLPIAVLNLEAFPSLMDVLAGTLMHWSSVFLADPQYAAAMAQAAAAISRISAAVQNPIYRKQQRLII